MGSFCGNCGAPLDDDARVCGQCGTPIYGKKVVDVKNIEKKRKLKKRITTIIVLAIICIVGIGIYKIVYNHTGIMGFSRKVMNAYVDYDIDTIAELSSDKFFYDSSGAEDVSLIYFKGLIGMEFDYYENVMKANDKIKYNILEVNELSEHKKEKVMDSLKYEYSKFDSTVIEELTEVRVRVILGKKEESPQTNISLIVSKENGNLRLFDIKF